MLVPGKFSHLLFPLRRDECGWFRHILANLSLVQHRTRLITIEEMLAEINEELDELLAASKKSIFNIKDKKAGELDSLRSRRER